MTEKEPETIAFFFVTINFSPSINDSFERYRKGQRKERKGKERGEKFFGSRGNIIRSLFRRGT